MGNAMKKAREMKHKKDEIEERIRRFHETDTNEDGFLTYEEIEHYYMAKTDARPDWKVWQVVASCDKDGDGRVSLREFLKYWGEDEDSPETERTFWGRVFDWIVHTLLSLEKPLYRLLEKSASRSNETNSSSTTNNDSIS